MMIQCISVYLCAFVTEAIFETLVLLGVKSATLCNHALDSVTIMLMYSFRVENVYAVREHIYIYRCFVYERVSFYIRTCGKHLYPHVYNVT